MRRLIIDAEQRACAELGEAPVLLQGAANCQRGWEAAGGWLVLSPDLLVFAAHKVNVQWSLLRMPLAELHCVRPCWTLLFGKLPIAPNGLLVEDGQGVEYRFVVHQRHRWVEAIEPLLRD